MTTLAADSPQVLVGGGMGSIPIIASDIVYEGAMVGDNAAGYGRPLVAGDKFVGHSITNVVNATAVDGVYTKDPNKYDDAEKIAKMSFEELLECCKTSEWKAGPSNVFDAMGAEIIAKNRIPLLVVKGRDLEALESAIKGEPFSGTTVGGE